MPASFPTYGPVPNQFLKKINGISVHIKREDLLHPEISGNKFRKLKYNMERAVSQNVQRLLTFGGAFSNHIAATAAAGKLYDLGTIGVIRGEELGEDLERTLEQNTTLRFAHSCGMRFKFLSREDYRKKESRELLQGLGEEFGEFYLLPEGGTNPLAIKGCEEILVPEDERFDYICCPVGTGGTISGVINAAGPYQKVLGFPALKGDFLASGIEACTKKNNWKLIPEYHFGGYAKVDPVLIDFMNEFRREHGIILDPVYTGKMMFGILDLIKKGYFSENPRILAIHTGGLQGISGMNRMLRNKNYPLIDV